MDTAQTATIQRQPDQRAVRGGGKGLKKWARICRIHFSAGLQRRAHGGSSALKMVGRELEAKATDNRLRWPEQESKSADGRFQCRTGRAFEKDASTPGTGFGMVV